MPHAPDPDISELAAAYSPARRAMRRPKLPVRRIGVWLPIGSRQRLPLPPRAGLPRRSAHRPNIGDAHSACPSPQSSARAGPTLGRVPTQNIGLLALRAELRLVKTRESRGRAALCALMRYWAPSRAVAAAATVLIRNPRVRRIGGGPVAGVSDEVWQYGFSPRRAAFRPWIRDKLNGGAPANGRGGPCRGRRPGS